MGPASSREDEEDPTAADNGLAIAIPFKTSENHDELQQPPEETVRDLLFVFIVGSSARNGPVYAGIAYQKLFLFLKFIPVLSLYKVYIYPFPISLTICPSFDNFHFEHWLALTMSSTVCC
jgi:hypothetical protein